MKRTALALLSLALLSACKDKPSMQLRDAPSVPVERAQKWALTLPLLDGYLRYQRTLLVQAGKLTPSAWDGGLKHFDDTDIEQKASADERARQGAGLTPDDVTQIEAIVSRVASKKLTGRLMGINEADQPPPIDPEHSPEMQATLVAQAQLRKATTQLPEERQLFGSATIDLLLQREEEVLRNWALMLEVPELAAGRR